MKELAYEYLTPAQKYRSIKARSGAELDASTSIVITAWKLKGILDFSYDYELAYFNEREKEKGAFRTKGTVGVEVEYFNKRIFNR